MKYRRRSSPPAKSECICFAPKVYTPMARLRMNNPGLRFFLHYWQKYCTLQDWHISWARQHLHVRAPLRKGTLLHQEGETQTHVYLVAQGPIARIEYTEAGARRIRSAALPGLAPMPTGHLSSRTARTGGSR